MSNLIDDAQNERKAIIASTSEPTQEQKNKFLRDYYTPMNDWLTIAKNAESAIEQALYYLDHHAPGRAREILALAHERKPIKL